jgi:hypothetical protein
VRSTDYRRLAATTRPSISGSEQEFVRMAN